MTSRLNFRPPRWLGWPGVVLVILVGVLSYFYEDFKEQFPGLITAQLWAYQGLSRISLRTPQAKWVVPIEIDDKTFYEFLNNQNRNDVTDRQYLAGLIKTVADASPAVIALDINFDATSLDKPAGSQSPFAQDDELLFKAILYAQQRRIPVVLTYGFRHGMQPVPQIFNGLPVYTQDGVSFDLKGISFEFPEEEDPSRKFWVPRFGFDHPAEDFRKVPLVAVGPDEHGEGLYDYYSFALQAADAYSRWAAETPHYVVLPPMAKRRNWSKKLEEYEFVYTTFMPVTDFVGPKLRAFSPDAVKPLSAIEVYCDVPPGKQGWSKEVCPAENAPRVELVPDLLRDKIVIIGGDRHGYRGEEGPEDVIDDHQSPVGPLRGMYFQANYIEGLLDNRVLFTVSRWLAALIDVVLALFVLWVASHVNSYRARAGLIAVLLLVPAFVAIVFARFGFCLDFVFPLVLLLLHPALESYIHLVPGLRHEELVHE